MRPTTIVSRTKNPPQRLKQNSTEEDEKKNRRLTLGIHRVITVNFITQLLYCIVYVLIKKNIYILPTAVFEFCHYVSVLPSGVNRPKFLATQRNIRISNTPSLRTFFVSIPPHRAWWTIYFTLYRYFFFDELTRLIITSNIISEWKLLRFISIILYFQQLSTHY